MIGKTEGITKSVKGTTAIPTAYTIGKFGADDDTMSLASASTDDLACVFQHTTENAGDDVSVMVTGITNVKLGGTVTRGKWATADANGKAVQAAPSTGVNASIIGKFMASGVDGDIVPLLLAPGVFQG